MGIRPFLYPCLRPGIHPPPPGNPDKVFKRFDPHEFDDPKSLLDDSSSLSSDDEDEGHQEKVGDNTKDGIGYSDGPFGAGAGAGSGSGGGEMDYDTQAYQSLAALLEASNDSELFQTNGIGQ